MVANLSLSNFPTKRIKPNDGLAITSSVWEEAHEYHRQRQRFHDRILHTHGIAMGLEVIASDPPDSSVYIMPGAAVDPDGEMVLVPEAINFDFGSTFGKLFLMLTYGESRPVQDDEDGPAYIESQFSIESGTALQENAACIILAEINRERGEAIRNAANPELPALNEIDLRFRDEINLYQKQAETTRIGVCYAGERLNTKNGHGAVRLARALRHSGKRVWADDDAPITNGLENYSLVYLVGKKDAKLNREEMNAIYAYIQQGGTVLMENCTSDQLGKTEGINGFYLELAASYGIQIEEPKSGDLLVEEPHLFTILPAGPDSGGSPKILAGDGLIVSGLDLGCLWQGERNGAPVSREEIRSAVEFGENILLYAEKRKSKVQAG